MAIKERYVGRINIFHNAKQTLTAGEPVAFDVDGNVVPALANKVDGLSAQNVIADDGKLSGSYGVSLDSVTAVGRVGDPVGVYQKGVYKTNLIKTGDVVAVDELLYVDTASRTLTHTSPGAGSVVVAVVEALADADGFVLIRLLAD